MRRAIAVACVVLGSAAALPGVALATTQRSGWGKVSATFSFSGSPARFENLHLKITMSGKTLFNSPVRSRLCGSRCGPLITVATPGGSSVRTLDLESDGQPDVVLSLYSGGAHCCVIDQVYSLAPGSRTYLRTEHDFGNPGASIRDLGHNGDFEFLTADNAFYYAFATFASSGAPVQIWSFRNRQFLDVTREYPKRIASDANRWWHAFMRSRSAGGEGLAAAWAADEDLLGHSALISRRLATEARQGNLFSDLPGAPTGKDFIAALQKFLRKHGYLK